MIYIDNCELEWVIGPQICPHAPPSYVSSSGVGGACAVHLDVGLLLNKYIGSFSGWLRSADISSYLRFGS